MRAIDTETVHAGTVSEPVPALVCVAQYHPSEGGTLEAAHRVDWHRVAETYRRGAVLANSPFDAFVFRRAGPDWLWQAILDAYERGSVFDVNTAEKMIAAATGRKVYRVNLGVVCDHYGIPVDKDDPVRKRYREVLGMEVENYPHEFAHYAMNDPVATWRAKEAQVMSAPPGCLDTLPVQTQGHIALYNQTVLGILNDKERAAILDESIATRMNRIAFYLMRQGLMRLEGGATKRSRKPPEARRNEKEAKKVMSQWCERTDNEITETKKGPSLSADALRKANIPDDHILRGYALYGSLSSLRNKNIPVFLRDITRTRYDEFKVTGRTGSSNPAGTKKAANCGPDEWTGTNLQNLARPDTLASLGFDEGEGFRECLIPRPGYGFAISDWGGAELVTLAQTCLRIFGWSKLADILNEGRDLHGEMAAKILGIEDRYGTPEERKALKLVRLEKNRPGEGMRLEDAPSRVQEHFAKLAAGSWAIFDKDGVHEHKQARQLAKAADFGFPGGLGARRFVDFARTQYNITVTEPEARRLKKLWKQLLPEMNLYFEWINSLAIGGGQYRVTIPGVGMTRICGFNDACNFPFQGAAAIAAKRALWWLLRAGMEKSSPLYGTRQVLFVHDENVSEVPIERKDEAIPEKERIMISAFGTICPDVHIGVETGWSDCYDK